MEINKSNQVYFQHKSGGGNSARPNGHLSLLLF